MKSGKFLPNQISTLVVPRSLSLPSASHSLKMGTWRLEVPVLIVRVLDNCVSFLEGTGFSDERI